MPQSHKQLPQENPRGFDNVLGCVWLLVPVFETPPVTLAPLSFFADLPANELQCLQQLFKQEDPTLLLLIDSRRYLESAVSQFEALTKYADTIKESERDLMISFCFSKASIYLSGCHLGYLTNDPRLFRNCLERLLSYHPYIVSHRSQLEMEVLYGVPGYLYMLLELQDQYFNKTKCDFSVTLTKEVSELVEIVVDHGIANYVKFSGKTVELSSLPSNFRLVYCFGDSEYLGGAHGLTGVLNMLLISLEKNTLSEQLALKVRWTVVASVEFLLRQIVNGNVPAHANSKHADTVQFCHGAPAAVTPLLHFCHLFPDEAKQLKVREHVKVLFEQIWRYGVIKKGFYGLCHGISGNAYTFVSSVCRRVLPEMKEEYLTKASLMWLLQADQKTMESLKGYKLEDRYCRGVSDFPYSLMLGSAGDLCFCMDLMRGEGHFPGYDL